MNELEFKFFWFLEKMFFSTNFFFNTRLPQTQNFLSFILTEKFSTHSKPIKFITLLSNQWIICPILYLSPAKIHWAQKCLYQRTNSTFVIKLKEKRVEARSCYSGKHDTSWELAFINEEIQSCKTSQFQFSFFLSLKTVFIIIIKNFIVIILWI